MTAAKVPTTLFTGFFGVGKTTAIRHLLSRKNPDERWAVLVNEFGEVPIDGAAFEPDEAETEGVLIREIAGGCMCCTMNLPMKVAIMDVLRRARPERLIIEPTGIGHPAGILDELRGDDLRDAVDVGAVICLVDPRVAQDPRLREAALFRDQVHLADVLVANKADLAAAADLKAFDAWARDLFPPKAVIETTSQGVLDPALLDLAGDAARAPLFPHLHDHDHGHDHGHDHPSPDAPDTGHLSPGKPIRRRNAGEGFDACGWIFDAQDVFRRDDLVDLLGPPGPVENLQRLKGVFRTPGEWLLIDRVRNEMTVTPIAYRRDSRVEVIADTGNMDWTGLEGALLDLIETG